MMGVRSTTACSPHLFGLTRSNSKNASAGMGRVDVLGWKVEIPKFRHSKRENGAKRCDTGIRNRYRSQRLLDARGACWPLKLRQ